MARDVFICHSSKDQASAETLCAVLEAARVRCWIAPRDIPPGTNYGPAIIDAINGCRVLVLILSKASNESVHVVREVERAVNRKGVRIIPLRMEDVTPSRDLEYFISACQWFDGFPPPLDRRVQRLATYLQRFLKGRVLEGERTEPPPPPPDPGVWTALVATAAGALLIAAALFVCLYWFPLKSNETASIPPLAMTPKDVGPEPPLKIEPPADKKDDEPKPGVGPVADQKAAEPKPDPTPAPAEPTERAAAPRDTVVVSRSTSAGGESDARKSAPDPIPSEPRLPPVQPVAAAAAAPVPVKPSPPPTIRFVTPEPNFQHRSISPKLMVEVVATSPDGAEVTDLELFVNLELVPVAGKDGKNASSETGRNWTRKQWVTLKRGQNSIVAIAKNRDGSGSPERLDGNYEETVPAIPTKVMKADQPYLGLVPDLKRDVGGAGVYVFGIKDGSPAEQADIRERDRLEQFNGQDIRTWNDYVVAMSRCRPGQSVRLKLTRVKQILSPTVRLGVLPNDAGGAR